MRACHLFALFCKDEAPICPSNPNSTTTDIKTVSVPGAGDIIIDIRHPAEVDAKPLVGGDNKIIVLPFFNLEQQLGQLNKNTCYLLYCEKGIMSRLQALLMREKGFNLVGIFSGKTYVNS